MSPFWHLEFGGVALIFGTSVHPCSLLVAILPYLTEITQTFELIQNYEVNQKANKYITVSCLLM
jgi:hypothetical protein